MKRAVAGFAALLAVAPWTAIAQQAPTDSELVQKCLDELKSRQSPEESHGNTVVTASKVERSETQQIVTLQATEAEGRPASARCVIRNGKIFDFRE